MEDTLKLMAVLAHPDDESLGNGGMLAKYAAEGIEIDLVVATRGERGWPGKESDYPGPEALGQMREAEVLEAAGVLGIHNVQFLGYLDGELDQAHPAEIIAKIVGHLRRVKPDVVVTFGPFGGYGHPDHIAISQFTTAAIVEAANPASLYYRDLPPHSVSKLYYMAEAEEVFAVYQSVFGDLVMSIDGVKRGMVTWPAWSASASINTWDHWRTVARAISCHRTQVPAYHVLENLSSQQRKMLWGTQTYYRVFSLVNGGRQAETDLFAGLR
ncbi:MAG TPA: PIG-L family deacetylase [Ktedonobacteraceae bacterium]|nr:PIG-L family deacetylase [Ktedonobacteraceae bacterium]